MKKDMMIFGSVTMIAMIAATIGHAVYPPFCIAAKPLAWPFLALAYVAIKRLVVARKNKESK